MQKFMKYLLFCVLLCSSCCNAVYAEPLEESYTEVVTIEQGDVTILAEVDKLVGFSDYEMDFLSELLEKHHDMTFTIATTPAQEYADKTYRSVKVTIESVCKEYEVLPPESSLLDAMEYFLRNTILEKTDETCMATIYETHTLQFLDFYEHGKAYNTRGINSSGHVKIITEETNFVLVGEKHYENIPLVMVALDEDFGRYESLADFAEKSSSYYESFWNNARYHAQTKYFSYNKFQKFDSVISL